MFGKVLSDAELAGVYTLIDRYIHPKYRIVTAGDSMSGPDLGLGRYLRDGSGFFGSNLNLCTDLSATDNLPVMVGKLVTTGGGSLNCSLVDSGCPNILVTWFGHHENEVPLCSALDTYNNMKLIWARAKSLGMKVATCTVNPTIDLANDEAAHGTETKRRAINDMMRADVDAGYFDYLLDTESFFINACGLSGLPPANTVTSSALWTFNNATYFDGGHIHLTAAGGQAITDALYARIANAIP